MWQGWRRCMGFNLPNSGKKDKISTNANAQKEIIQEAVKALFPKHPKVKWRETNLEQIIEFNNEDLLAATSKLKKIKHQA